MPDEPEQGAAPPGLLLGEGHGLDLVHPGESGLGERDERRHDQQHEDDDEHRQVGGGELGGDHSGCS